MRRQACSLIVGFGVALTVWLWPAPDLRAAERLRIVYSAISGSFAPIWIAQEAGLFEREGLRTDLVYIATSTIAVPSLISGDSQIMMGGGGAVVLARLGGADINIFATSLPVIVQMLIAPPSIARPADLKGKRVGVTRIGALSDFTLRYLIRKWGMDPDRDIRILQMGGLPEVLLGLQAGRIDAGVTAPPHTVRAAKLGIRILSDASTEGPRYPAIVLGATDGYLNRHRKQIGEFLKAFLAGTRRVKADRELTMKVFGRYTRTPEPEILAEMYRAYAPHFAVAPRTDAEMIRVVFEEVADRQPKAKSADPNAFFRNDLIDEALARESGRSR